MAEGLHLLALLSVPGLVILLQLRRSVEDPAMAVIGAFALSLTYNAVVGLVLLRFGWFNQTTVTVAVAAVALTLPLRLAVARANARRWWRRRQSLLAPGAIAIMVVVAVLVTPRWTFLVATHMDAGNYEVYSNHFWTTGELYFHVDQLVARGVPMEWIAFRNTWYFEGNTGRPAYFYAYPVLVGITKSTFGSYAVSWVFNGLIAAASAFSLVVVARRFVSRNLLAGAVVLPVITTPLFFYYAKQQMSEGLALFAVTAMLAFLLPTTARNRLATGFLAAAAMGLLVLTKIDTVVPALMFVGIVAYVSSTRDRKMLPSGASMGVASGFAVASTLNVWLVADRYLVRVSPATYVTGLDRSSLAGDGVVLLLVVAVAAILAFAVWVGRAGYLQGPSRRTFDQAVAWAIVLAWWTFVLWNLTLRPATGSLESNHDAINLLRLFAVFSPLGIAVLVLGAPTLIRLDGLKRWLSFGLVIAVGMLVLRSAHTRSEVWWMRRYLAAIVPATVVVGAGTVAWLRERAGRWRSWAGGALGLAFLVATFMQGLDMRPLFAHEVNVNAPDRLSRTLRTLPGELPLIVASDGPPAVMGMGNILRSLRTTPTLLDVPVEDLPRAMESLRPSPVAVIASRPFGRESLRSLRLELVGDGEYAVQWENWLGEIAEDPAREDPQPFYIYLERTS